MKSFIIPVPREFNFDHCFSFLVRSPKELLHQCENGKVRKLIRLEHNDVLFELSSSIKNDGLMISVLNTTPSPEMRTQLEKFILEWFDLETDLKPFYTMAKKDSLLKDLVKNFYGYRIVGQPDLFESLVWAVLGQQINVQFAYTLKQRFVEMFGEKMIYENRNYYLFPKPETVALLNDDHLLPLQFSRIRDYQYKAQTLQISFLDGSVYEYFDIPKNIYNKLLNAETPDRFARRHIYHSFVYRKVSKALTD